MIRYMGPKGRLSILLNLSISEHLLLIMHLLLIILDDDTFVIICKYQKYTSLVLQKLIHSSSKKKC